MGVSIRAIEAGSRATAGLTVAAAGFTFFVLGLIGDTRLALAATVALFVGVSVLVHPQWGLVVLLVATCTMLPGRVGAVDIGGVRTDAAEVLVFLLIGGWVVRRVAEPDVGPNPLIAPLLAMLGAGCFGAAVALASGAAVSDVLGPLKTFAFWLVALPVVAAVRAHEGLRWLERIVLVAATATAGLTVILAVTGWAIPSSETTEVVTLGVASQAQRILPAGLQLEFLATLLIVNRGVLNGWSARSIAILVSLLVGQAISFNRSTWATLALCLLLYAFFHPGTRQRNRGLATALAVIVMFGATGAAAVSGLLGPTPQAVALRARSTLTPAVFGERSQTLRNEESSAALAMIARRPLTGVGLNQPYGARFSQYSEGIRGGVYLDHQTLHNSYLKLWLETGLPGVAALTALVLVVVRIRRTGPSGQLVSERGLSLAVALALLGLALQATYQTSLYHRPTLVTIGVALGMLVLAAQPPTASDSHTSKRMQPQALNPGTPLRSL